MISTRLRILTVAGAVVLLGGCQSRPEADPGAVAGAHVPGAISVAFRNRWWHFYERGLSWADGGMDVQAEADFRQCLSLRLRDSRQARTYGMHFVQCFAHRELGAVLLRRGALEEAERELRLSLAQEPSAKAEYLLERLAQLRTGAAAGPDAPPPATAPAGNSSIEITSVEPVQALLRIAGRLVGDLQVVAWSMDAAGKATRLDTDASGSFHGEVVAGSTLRLGTAAGPDLEALSALAVAPPDPAPTLDLDGPDQGAVVGDGRAWYRWRAAAAAGLERLAVHDDHGTLLADIPLRGLRAAGTLRLELAGGGQTLGFRLGDRAGAVSEVRRRVESRSRPQQDRSLRAVALAIPLQSPRPHGLRSGDDPRLRSALLEDGRFRFIDSQADELLARELMLVEAGFVDRSTAAAAGRRLACRYVIAGTMNRGERDAECFLRLVHSDSGRVVASADAYAEIASSADADRLFAATAGRLRQVFPVVAGSVVQQADGRVRLEGGSRTGVVALMRVHVFPVEPAAGATPSGSIEIETVDEAGAQARISDGGVPAQGWGVSE